MEKRSTGRIFSFPSWEGLLFFFLLIVSSVTAQSTATITGTVTNVLSGNPVIGAKIQAGTASAYSVAGGAYSLSVPPGNYQLLCTKSGFENFTTVLVNLQAGTSTTVNIPLAEMTNPPVNAFAHIDSIISPTAITVEWSLPAGPYELLYDDGIQENFSVWAVQGNMNAVKFSPSSLPAKVTGGKVNIGNASNYPAGSNPLVPFQIAVYNDAGTSGMPGQLIGGPFDVIPSSTGWISFVFSAPVVVNGGFYLVMIQGGNAPNAAGIAIDETNSQQRSCSRFVTGSSPWLPVQGNFMMRADLIGAGGPFPPLLGDSPSSAAGLMGYTVYRLRQGEEMNPAVWTTVGYPTTEKLNDFSWLSLPCGPYRWGIRANYSGNRISPVSFSNVIGKCWTQAVTVDVTLSCPATPVSGSMVKMTNLVYPDTVYSQVLTTSSQAVFPKIWRGTYNITTTRFGYQQGVQIQSVASDTGFFVNLLQEQAPPNNLSVNDTSLFIRWSPPRPEKTLFNEEWDSGNFNANGWTVEGGQNWTVSTLYGYPHPSAMFGYSPAVQNYSQTLTSRNIQGENAAVMKLCYNFSLDNYGNTTVNQMAVELWDGVSWHLLKNYTNAGGSIDWTYEELDISAYSGSLFRIRFRAYGEDSYDINHWNFDNIKVIARESLAVSGSCVIGYYVYLNNILCTVTTDTSSYLPAQFVLYGSSNTCCVKAIYASGPSIPVCSTFISHYLPPPTALTAVVLNQGAVLHWNKPELPGQPGVTPPGLTGYTVFRNGSLVDTIHNPDTLVYQDPVLFPGNYYYHVAALYDLTLYAFTGTGSSAKAGPASILISYGQHLPFTEGWEQGNFSVNGWSAGQNWIIDNNEGNPAPSASFVTDPILTNYSEALESTIFNTMNTSCSGVWLDYDITLISINSSMEEKLVTEIYLNNTWHVLEVFTNFNNLPWDHRHVDISAVKGRAFKIRFRAAGVNSSDILYWKIDNISLYAVCKPPLNLTGSVSGSSVSLSWDPPQCDDGHGLDEGFEEPVFPPGDWTTVVTNSASSWYQSNVTLPTGVHSGNYAATVSWDYAHQDEWLIARNILVTGNLTYWAHAFQGSTHLDHYYVKISDNNGLTWDILSDLSAMPPYPSASGYNEWETPYTVDLSPYVGEVVDIAWHAVDGDMAGLRYSWSVDDCSVGSGAIPPAAFDGYDIYRKDPDENIFNLINNGAVAGTSYIDEGLNGGDYEYYIVQASAECSQKVSSDTILIGIISGTTNEPVKNIIKVYPNPSRDIINISSSDYILNINLYNGTGIVLIESTKVNTHNFSFSTQNLSAGIYFLKILTSDFETIERVVVLK